MKVQLIRHATLKINYKNRTFLVDPMFSIKSTLPAVANSANEFRNPLVDLPVSVESILEGIDAVIISHLHRDHFDDAAIIHLPKEIQIICQPEDEGKIRELQFTQVTPIEKSLKWNGIRISRTKGEHGTGKIGEKMGPVSGFVLEGEGEKTLYLAGDTIWCNDVNEAILEYHPSVIILNGGEAQFLQGDPITMGPKDISLVRESYSEASIVVVHMESWNHCLLTRKQLNEYIENKELSHIVVPMDGEILDY
ncbi:MULTISPECIES: MBL fold metallo-hydrolase [unclassified Bacillus (in: firmicutes)]|uniref:MBL fold metallo-hydrolase n=1 Tax=unclassified Bacillus (in: firmicutes) TaxID=185979 RepID=UPI0008E0B047|nr:MULTISPECIES: MBL fold metallo-hydrolase [unclassified Bacillus (in: firmicutes)]SFA86734.1 Beta-lactamase superfamily domain-containing protein [Bacillus sp. UNCCL13]SFQ83842.1 Beta-lactamase superfamily domain-containing protein [Bacillus sp. cl95]